MNRGLNPDTGVRDPGAFTQSGYRARLEWGRRGARVVLTSLNGAVCPADRAEDGSLRFSVEDYPVDRPVGRRRIPRVRSGQTQKSKNIFARVSEPGVRHRSLSINAITRGRGEIAGLRR